MRSALQWPLAALSLLLLLLPLCVPSTALRADARPSYPAHASMPTRPHAHMPVHHSGGPAANPRGGAALRGHSGGSQPQPGASPSIVRVSPPPVQECPYWRRSTSNLHGDDPIQSVHEEVAALLAQSIAAGGGLGPSPQAAQLLRPQFPGAARSPLPRWRDHSAADQAQRQQQQQRGSFAPPPPPSLRSAHYNATEQSLLDFWQRSGGPDWTYPANQPFVRWNTANTSFCAWWGVVCDPSTQSSPEPVVTEILLREMSLQGFVPDMFSALVNLTTIDLYSNCLYSTDGLDLDMTPFSQLARLDLSTQWNLAANLPDTFFASLPKLEFLDLG